MKGYENFFEVGPRLGPRLGGQPTTRLNQDKPYPLLKGIFLKGERQEHLACSELPRPGTGRWLLCQRALDNIAQIRG